MRHPVVTRHQARILRSAGSQPMRRPCPFLPPDQGPAPRVTWFVRGGSSNRVLESAPPAEPAPPLGTLTSMKLDTNQASIREAIDAGLLAGWGSRPWRP